MSIGAGAGVVSVGAGAGAGVGVVSVGAGAGLLFAVWSAGACVDVLLSLLPCWLFGVGAGVLGPCGRVIDCGIAGAVGAGSEVDTGKPNPSPVL